MYVFLFQVHSCKATEALLLGKLDNFKNEESYVSYSCVEFLASPPYSYAFVPDRTEWFIDAVKDYAPFFKNNKRKREEALDPSNHELKQSLRMSIVQFNSTRNLLT